MGDNRRSRGFIPLSSGHGGPWWRGSIPVRGGFICHRPGDAARRGPARCARRRCCFFANYCGLLYVIAGYCGSPGGADSSFQHCAICRNMPQYASTTRNNRNKTQKVRRRNQLPGLRSTPNKTQQRRFAPPSLWHNTNLYTAMCRNETQHDAMRGGQCASAPPSLGFH